MPDRGAQRNARRLPLDVGASRLPDVQWRVPAAVAVVASLLACADAPRRGLWLALGTVALGFIVASLSARFIARRRGGAGPEAWLVIDDDEITRVQASGGRSDGRGKTLLARWGAPFGLSVLANAARSRVLLAFTTPSTTRFLALRVETPRDADVARDVLERAITVADVDLELAAGSHLDVQLDAGSARTLLGEIETRDPSALHRLYLSDARGGAIAVERDRLVIGQATFDLAAPVDWRVFTFQDGDAGAAGLYQATAVKQGGSDVVFVCRAPAELVSWGGGRAPDAAPPRDSRVAIDRLFMTPLRAVLEQAPRVSRPPSTGARTRRSSVAR